jgi:hypothetical protein
MCRTFNWQLVSEYNYFTCLNWIWRTICVKSSSGVGFDCTRDKNCIPVTNLMHKFLYSYNVTVLHMFRAVLCSSSGDQIICIQHMVSSLSVSGRGGRTVHWLRENCQFSVNQCTAVLSQPVYCSSLSTSVLQFSLNLCTAVPYQPVYCSSLSTSVLHNHHDHSYRVTIPYAVYIQFDLLRMSITLLETCRGL